MKKKLFKVLAVFFLVMFFGWLGSLFFGRYLTPLFVNSKTFSQFEIFKNDNKNTTIINQTEKIVVRETESIGEISSNAAYAVVNIFSFQKGTESNKKLGISNATGKYSLSKYGTGTILTNDGIIITHRDNIILENADYKIITLSGSTFSAQLEAVDDFSELAYLKVADANLTTIPFGNNNNSILGKKVIAMGKVSSLKQSLITEGVLSGYVENFNLSGGEIGSSEKLEGIMQVNFSANDSYVGGPVINYNGELLAITSKIKIDGQEKYFQIPIEIIKDSVEKVIENRIKEVAKLGIYYISIDSFHQESRSLTVDKGAMVYSPSGKQGLAVIAGSVAEKSGIKIGDIIVSIDGNEINSAHPLSNLIYQYEKGTEATLNVLRDGEMMEVLVTF